MSQSLLPHVGNDVVDLSNERTHGKAGDERFMRRIFTDSELAVVSKAAEPDREVWRLWAAKESAFKVVSKLMSEPPPFDHSAFEVAWSGHSEAAFRHGIVSYGDHRIDVRVEDTEEFVRALGWTPTGGDAVVVSDVRSMNEPDAVWAAPRNELDGLLTARELDAVHSDVSAAVRVGAKAAVADALDVDLGRIEIVCAPGALGRRPPFVLVDGVQAAIDVSLAHDGEWLAWALLRTESSQGSR